MRIQKSITFMQSSFVFRKISLIFWTRFFSSSTQSFFLAISAGEENIDLLDISFETDEALEVGNELSASILTQVDESGS